MEGQNDKIHVGIVSFYEGSKFVAQLPIQVI